MATNGKLKGNVKSIKRDAGYGFITHDETGMDHFFHRSAIELTSRKKWDDLCENDRVVFLSIDAPKGKRAIEVASI